MNNKGESVIVVGRGRGNKGKPSQGDNSVLTIDLRRPYVNPPEVQPPHVELSAETASRIPMPVSILSADAPEFVPKSKYCDQKIVLEHDPSNTTDLVQPVLDYVAMPSVSNENVHFPVPQFKFVYHPIIVQVNDYVVKLSLKPHKFDFIANKMTALLSKNGTDKEIMKEAVSVIFEQGVGEPNFRFNGGRLCQHLSKHIIQSYDGPSFKIFLLQTCQEEFKCRDFYFQSDPARLCGFTLFLADIFVNVLTAALQPLEKLREALCTLLMLLLSSPYDLTLKCIVQALKGSGSFLDRGNTSDIDAVMYRVKDVAMTAKISDNIRYQLLSVVELRASNWGKRREEMTSTNVLDTPQIGTIYYNADGAIDRIEEETNDSLSSDSEDSQCGFSYGSDEMDGEMAGAFEEFLRNQNA